MTRFADSPYFLIKDFMQELVLPVDFSNAPVIPFNVNTDTVFTDVIWVGGITNFEPANPFYDSLLNYPSFNPLSDDATIFETADIIWNGWIDVADRPSYYLEDHSLPGVLMRGMEKSIVADGGRYIDLWAKTEAGFIPVRLTPVYEEPRENIYFRFDTVEIEQLNYDGTQVIYDSDTGSCSDGGFTDMASCEDNGHTWTPGDEPYYDSQYVSIQTYDYTITSLFSDDTVLDPSTEIYFRKDSAFHDWLKHERKAELFYDNKFDLDFVMRNYVNTDKLFIYFGKIYPTEQEVGNDANRYQIVYHGLKDWIQDALPPNNRKELFIEYLDTYFDMVYSEGYQQLKDIWSLRDAMECNETFLSYIPTFYGVKRYDDIPSWFADIYREYARDCIWLMKRKGTYASMYIIYDLFCRNSTNVFNVYERWHDDDFGSTSVINEEIELSESNVTAGGANPETVTIDGSKVNFLMPVGTQATATVDTIVLDASQDITMHVQLTATDETNNNGDSYVGMHLKDGNGDKIMTIAWSAQTFGAGNWLFTQYAETCEEGDDITSDIIFSLPETAYAYINYNSTTKVLSFDFDDGGVPEATVFITMKETVSNEWTIDFEGINPSGDLMEVDIDTLLIDSAVIGSPGGTVIDEHHDYPYIGYYDYPKNSVNYTPNVTADLGWTITNPVNGLEFNVSLDPVTKQLNFYLGDVDLVDGLGGSMNFEYQVYNANLIAIGENPFNPLDGSPENDILDGFTGGEMDFSYQDASGIWALNGGQQQWGVNTHYDEYFHTLDRLDETVLFRVKVRWISNNSGTDFRMAFGGEYVATNDDMVGVDYYFSTGSLSQLMKGNMAETVYGLFGYPDGYLSSNNERQSPLYRADLDLCNEPLTQNKIMPKQIAENLYSNWEIQRPVNRQAEYNFVYCPVTDLTGDRFTLYESPNTHHSVTWSTDNTKFDSENFIFLQRIPAQVWTINHGLETEDVYVSAWSTDLTKMVPDVITVVNENIVRVTFPLDTIGLVLVSKAQYNSFNHLSTKVFHGRNRNEMIVQLRNDATGNVEYPENIYNYDSNSLKVDGLDPAEDYSSYFIQGLRQGDSIEGHGPLDDTIWTFPDKVTDDENIWYIAHGFDANAFLVNCYNLNNEQIYPAEINYDYVNPQTTLPEIEVIFDEPVNGFAAIKHVGDVVSFYGIVPRDAAGNLQTLEWRLTTETDEEINTFVTPEQPEYVRYANSNKIVHSWDGNVNDKSNFVWGHADYWEEDELWYYYTVIVSNEALEQLNIKSYDVLDIQLVNPNITRLSKQTVSFSRISGIYKPFGVNLVVKVKIFKDPNGVGSTLLDHLDEALRDHTNDPTDWNLTT